MTDIVTPKPARRPSRLSEGNAPRQIDYHLSYDGKISTSEILAGPKAQVERVFYISKKESTSWRNRLYYGDNLKILRALCEDLNVYQKVKLVYIDPPFATGSVFETRNGSKAYEDTNSGAAYLEFIRQRLVLLRELMHEQGSIYLHLDGKMAFPMKVIMDEIFGPSNFRNFITRKKSNRKNFTRKQYGNVSDYILFYTKSRDYTWNRSYVPWTQETATEYQYIEPSTGRRFMKVPIHAPGIRSGETGKPWRGMLPPPGKHWQYPPNTLDELDAKGEIYWSPNGNPRRKIYFESSAGIPVQDIWLDCRDAHNQNIEVTGYPTEKPLKMLQRIVAASTDSDDLVLDCFLGSGTSIIAAEDTQRRWIGVDSSLEAVTTTITRLAKGSEPMGDFVNGKKKQERKLFCEPGPLKTSFELYTQPEQPVSHSLIREWKKLF